MVTIVIKKNNVSFGKKYKTELPIISLKFKCLINKYKGINIEIVIYASEKRTAGAKNKQKIIPIKHNIQRMIRERFLTKLFVYFMQKIQNKKGDIMASATRIISM